MNPRTPPSDPSDPSDLWDPSDPSQPPIAADPSDPSTPADPSPPSGSAMRYGGTFIRPGAIAWGGGGQRDQRGRGDQRDRRDNGDAALAEDGGLDAWTRAAGAMTEHALAAAVKDPDRVTDLLDELSRARLWLPLPQDDRPVTDGSAVQLPTVTYLGEEFVPAFTSARRLSCWASLPCPDGLGQARDKARAEGQAAASDGGLATGGQASAIPHIVVPAAELARRLPAGVGIALNPGARASVPIYPEGVGYLAASLVATDGGQIRVGHPPADPVAFLGEVRSALRGVPCVRQAARAWLSVPGRGEGLIISVTLDDPRSAEAHLSVLTAIERTALSVPRQAAFPVDVTFPGEGEQDQVDEWIDANAPPFYLRGLAAARAEQAAQARRWAAGRPDGRRPG